MTAAELKETLIQQTVDEEAAIARHNLVIQALSRHEGKKITRHLNRDLEKIGARISYRYGMTYVTFQKPKSMETFNHLLAYDNDPTVNMTRFEDLDGCHGRAAVARNESRRRSLNSTEASVLALQAFEAAALEFKKAVEGMGSETYEITGAAKATLQKLFLWRIS